MIEWFRNSGLVIYTIAQLSLINVSILSFSKIMQGKDHSLDIVLKFFYQAYTQVDLSSEGKIGWLSSCI